MFRGEQKVGGNVHRPVNSVEGLVDAHVSEPGAKAAGLSIRLVLLPISIKFTTISNLVKFSLLKGGHVQDMLITQSLASLQFEILIQKLSLQVLHVLGLN